MSIDLNLIELIFFFISILFIGEGVIYFLFPSYMKKMLHYILNLNTDNIRIIGLCFTFLGTMILYIIL
ncbi:MAG: ubiquitin-binding protein [Pelagibacterales bacterium]|nr:ubiquitin-binding protein [Pelagibacterales bacterium]